MESWSEGWSKKSDDLKAKAKKMLATLNKWALQSTTTETLDESSVSDLKELGSLIADHNQNTFFVYNDLPEFSLLFLSLFPENKKYWSALSTASSFASYQTYLLENDANRKKDLVSALNNNKRPTFEDMYFLTLMAANENDITLLKEKLLKYFEIHEPHNLNYLINFATNSKKKPNLKQEVIKLISENINESSEKTFTNIFGELKNDKFYSGELVTEFPYNRENLLWYFTARRDMINRNIENLKYEIFINLFPLLRVLDLRYGITQPTRNLVQAKKELNNYVSNFEKYCSTLNKNTDAKKSSYSVLYLFYLQQAAFSVDNSLEYIQYLGKALDTAQYLSSFHTLQVLTKLQTLEQNTHIDFHKVIILAQMGKAYFQLQAKNSEISGVCLQMAIDYFGQANRYAKDKELTTIFDTDLHLKECQRLSEEAKTIRFNRALQFAEKPENFGLGIKILRELFDQGKLVAGFKMAELYANHPTHPDPKSALLIIDEYLDKLIVSKEDYVELGPKIIFFANEIASSNLYRSDFNNLFNKFMLNLVTRIDFANLINLFLKKTITIKQTNFLLEDNHIKTIQAEILKKADAQLEKGHDLLNAINQLIVSEDENNISLAMLLLNPDYTKKVSPLDADTLLNLLIILIQKIDLLSNSADNLRILNNWLISINPLFDDILAANKFSRNKLDELISVYAAAPKEKMTYEIKSYLADLINKADEYITLVELNHNYEKMIINKDGAVLFKQFQQDIQTNNYIKSNLANLFLLKYVKAMDLEQGFHADVDKNVTAKAKGFFSSLTKKTSQLSDFYGLSKKPLPSYIFKTFFEKATAGNLFAMIELADCIENQYGGASISGTSPRTESLYWYFRAALSDIPNGYYQAKARRKLNTECLAILDFLTVKKPLSKDLFNPEKDVELAAALNKLQQEIHHHKIQVSPHLDASAILISQLSSTPIRKIEEIKEEEEEEEKIPLPPFDYISEDIPSAPSDFTGEIMPENINTSPSAPILDTEMVSTPLPETPIKVSPKETDSLQQQLLAMQNFMQTNFSQMNEMFKKQQAIIDKQNETIETLQKNQKKLEREIKDLKQIKEEKPHPSKRRGSF